MKFFCTVTGGSSNGGTVAVRKYWEMHSPCFVPENGPLSSSTVATLPVGSKTTLTLPVPVSPSYLEQNCALAATALSADVAAVALN